MTLVSTPRVYLTDTCSELTLRTSRTRLSSHTYVQLPSPAAVLAFCWWNIAHAVELCCIRSQKPQLSHEPPFWPGTSTLDLNSFSLNEGWSWRRDGFSRSVGLTDWHIVLYHHLPLSPMYTKLIPHSSFQKIYNKYSKTSFWSGLVIQPDDS